MTLNLPDARGLLNDGYVYRFAGWNATLVSYPDGCGGWQTTRRNTRAGMPPTWSFVAYPSPSVAAGNSSSTSTASGITFCSTLNPTKVSRVFREVSTP